MILTVEGTATLDPSKRISQGRSANITITGLL